MSQNEVIAEVTGTVWKIEAKVGDVVQADDVILVVESMKMEIPVMAPVEGRLLEIRVAEGDAVEDGQVVAVVEG